MTRIFANANYDFLGYRKRAFVVTGILLALGLVALLSRGLNESIEFTGKSLTEGGLRLGYLWGNGKYEAALYGRNITNQIRVVGGIDFNNLTGFINEPRTWGAEFRWNF